MNVLNKYKYFITFAVVTTAISTYLLGPQLFVLLGGFYTLTLLALKSSNSKRQKKFILISAFLYPFIEYGIKVFIISNIIPYSYIWINRIEHALFSIVISYYIFIVLDKIIPSQKIKKLHYSILLGVSTISLLNLFGVFNEILEMIIRIYWQMDMRRYYMDTMLDLITNLVASVLIVIILVINKTRNDRK